MTDEEKIAFCKKATGFYPTILPPSLYAMYEKFGCDMRFYLVQGLIPTVTEKPLF